MVLQSGVRTIRGSYCQGSYNHGFSQPEILITRGLTSRSITTITSYNKWSYKQGFLPPGVLQLVVLQPGVLTTRGLLTRGLTSSGLYKQGSYNQGCYNLGFWQPGVLQPGVCYNQGPVVRRPISANPGLNFNPGFFFFCSKVFSQVISSLFFRASNHQIVGRKNKTEFASQAFISEIKFRTNRGLP